MIKNVLIDDVFEDPDIAMLIMNALAMDLTWEVKFDRANTYGGTFYKDDDQKLKVTMMSLKKSKYCKYILL